jgi:hypothetical protein
MLSFVNYNSIIILHFKNKHHCIISPPPKLKIIGSALPPKFGQMHGCLYEDIVIYDKEIVAN